jgi:hypothetical protein
VEEYGRARPATEDDVILRIRTACRIQTATNTRSEYTIVIAFPQQQWLREQNSKLRHTYVNCLIFRRVREIAKTTISFVTSVRPSAWNNSSPIGGI